MTLQIPSPRHDSVSVLCVCVVSPPFVVSIQRTPPRSADVSPCMPATGRFTHPDTHYTPQPTQPLTLPPHTHTYTTPMHLWPHPHPPMRRLARYTCTAIGVGSEVELVFYADPPPARHSNDSWRCAQILLHLQQKHDTSFSERSRQPGIPREVDRHLSDLTRGVHARVETAARACNVSLFLFVPFWLNVISTNIRQTLFNNKLWYWHTGVLCFPILLLYRYVFLKCLYIYIFHGSRNLWNDRRL